MEAGDDGLPLGMGMRNLAPQAGQTPTEPALASSALKIFRHLGHLKAIIGCLVSAL
jgi:hypothetical protein